MFQTCQSMEFNESAAFKPNYGQEANNNIKEATNFMTIRTEYTHDFQNLNEKTNFNTLGGEKNNFNAIGEKTTNYYEDDFEEYNDRFGNLATKKSKK